MEALQSLWKGAELEAVESREITVRRTFANFDDFWTTNLKSPALGPVIAVMASADLDTLKSRVRSGLSVDAAGQITCRARAHAITGHRPK